ncbi:uncharacterized protein LOC132702210 [Cylas formicarius]|uniref:uncharacterized protein LOC132702210 n=1 Tax=Cylas formicarius TaxID=197179 RepID=UPI0029589C9B|nr:uncharacterized protein LOC132702210 [Cylas formicarius]
MEDSEQVIRPTGTVVPSDASENRKDLAQKNEKNDDVSRTERSSDSRVPGVEEARAKAETGEPNKPRARTIRNQSDIFSLKPEPTELATSIFSINGSPSRKIFRKTEPLPTGNVPRGGDDAASTDPKMAATRPVTRITRENYNDEKRPSSSYRNPLTGSGLSSNDEYKSKGAKRKDGNPLLGSGYESELAGIGSSDRVPPGGYSHRLW